MAEEILRDPLIRAMLGMTIVLLGVLIVMSTLEVLISVMEGKLIISGVTTISQLYGYIIGGVLVLGWGFFFPVYVSTRGRTRRYVPSEIGEAIDMYYKGLITRDQLIQIIDRYRQ